MDTATPGASGDIAATPSSSSAASPAVSTDSTQTAAPATEATPSPITDSTTGEPPKERWADILENTRKKEREAALTEWRQQYGWAESVPREQLEQITQFYGSYQDNPAEWLERAYQEALSHPVHGVTVKSRIGRMLASMRQAQAEPESPIPDIPIVNERNEPVGNLAEIVQRILAKEISPLKQDYETRQTEKQVATERAEQKARAEAMADEDVKYVKSRKNFKEHREAVMKAFQANKGMSLRDAYDYVIDNEVLPGYGQKAQAQVLSDLQQKANAQTVNPGTPSGSAKPKFKNYEEAAIYYEQHPEEAAAMANR